MAISLSRFWPWLLLIAATLLAYSNVYGNAFLFDDIALIVNNEFLKSWNHAGDIVTSSNLGGIGGAGLFYRPLPPLLQLVIWQSFGESTAAFHALNVGIHVLAACMVMLLCVKLGFGRTVSLIAALIWALHPIQTESVTYMSGTPDLLYSLFCLLGVTVLLPDFSPRRMMLSVLCLIAGMLSKETAMIMPALAMQVIFYLSERRWHWRSYVKTWPLWLTAISYLALRLTVLFPGIGKITTGIAPYDNFMQVRLQTFFAALVDYLKLIVWPQDLHMERMFPAYTNPFALQVVVGLGIVAIALLAVAWRAQQRRTDAAIFGILWFAVAMFPSSGIIRPISAIFFEHWLYLPTAGLILGVVGNLRDIKHAKWLGYASIPLIILLGTLTWQQNKTWHDPFKFYERIIELEPRSARAENNLGILYYAQWDMENAILHYRRALAIEPLYSDANCNIAMAIIKRNTNRDTIMEGLRHIGTALAVSPGHKLSINAIKEIKAWLKDHPEHAP